MSGTHFHNRESAGEARRWKSEINGACLSRSPPNFAENGKKRGWRESNPLDAALQAAARPSGISLVACLPV